MIVEVYVAICQERGDVQARVVFHAYDEEGRCKEVARYVPAEATPNQTTVRAIRTALERLQKHGHRGTVVYTSLKAAAPKGFLFGIDRFPLMVNATLALAMAIGCEVAWCSSGHPRMAAARAVARGEQVTP